MVRVPRPFPRPRPGSRTSVLAAPEKEISPMDSCINANAFLHHRGDSEGGGDQRVLRQWPVLTFGSGMRSCVNMS